MRKANIALVAAAAVAALIFAAWNPGGGLHRDAPPVRAASPDN